MKKNIAIILLFLPMLIFNTVLTAEQALADGEFDVYGTIESFTWKEFDDSGGEFLEESGPIFGAGITAKGLIQPLTIKGRAELFSGSVDYDGQTQAGMSVTSDTEYLGGKVEADLGWLIVIDETFALEPFAGIGYRWWERDIKSTGTAIGYIENWWSSYVRLGLRSESEISTQSKLFAEVGAKIAIKNENEVDLTEIGLPLITVEPANATAFFAEIGLRGEPFVISLFYEGLRFKKSDMVIVSAGPAILGFTQPESEADIFGLNAGFAF